MKTRILLLFFIALSFVAKSQPQGSTCDDPLIVDPIAAPLVDFAINSEAYGNDYTSSMITPSSTYLNGNDIVFQFTLAAKSYIDASIQGTYTGIFFLATCPNATTPAARLAYVGSSQGGTIPTFSLDAGSYFMIASTYTSTLFTDMLINFSAMPVPVDPTLTATPAELYVGMATPGFYTETKTLSLKNIGIPDAVINDGDFAFSGTNASDYTVTLAAGDTYPLTIPFGASKVVNVNFTPALVGESSANLDISYNNPGSPVMTVPVSGLGYEPKTYFHENFDGITPVPAKWLPNGWTRILQSTNTNAYVDVKTLTPFNGKNQLTFASYTDLNAKLILVSPTATNLNASRVYFAARMGSSSHIGKLEVGYLTSRTDPETFVAATTLSITGAYQLFSVDLKNAGISYPANAYIGIRYVPEVTNRTAVVDDIIYEVMPTQPIFNTDETTYDFGTTTWIYESSTQVCQIYNSGVGNLIINENDFQFAGTDADAFSIEFPEGQSWPISLAFGEYINTTLQFGPTEGREYNALLNITDNVTGKNVNTVTLTGTGYDAMIEPGFMFDFIGTFPPKDWRKFKGLFGTDVPAITTETAWHGRKFANDLTLPANNSACINIYGTARNHWLMTPPVDLGDGTQNYQLEFDLALTAKQNTNPSNFGTDQKFETVISTDGGKSWAAENVLRSWNSSTTISNTGEHIILDLSGYTGRIMVGFYGESTVTGGDVDLFITNVAVNDFQQISQIPLVEDFESASFPPQYWMAWDVDNTSPGWVASTTNNHTAGGEKSAYHDKGAENQAQDGWLVTPLLQIPAQGPVILKFWSYNDEAANYGKNSVLVSTGSENPEDGDFAEVWTTNNVSASWVHTTVDLTAFTNQTIYVAFNYQGTNAHQWFVDDVDIFVDESPTIVLSNTEYNKSQVEGVTSTGSLTVTNNGINNLIYQLTVEYLTGEEGWLSFDPASGDVQGGGFSQSHSLNFNSTGLGLGVHTANLIVSNNDPANPEVIIPCSITVNKTPIVEVATLINSYNWPFDLSANGDYCGIVAFGGSSNYLWSKNKGLTPITGLSVNLGGVSDAGVVAGSYKDPNLLYNGNPVQVAGTFDPVTSEWTFLGMNPAVPEFNYSSYQTGYGITADGITHVMSQYLAGSNFRSTKWTQAGGYDIIGASHTYANRPNGINRSGNLVYGYAGTAYVSQRSPAIWTNDTLILVEPTRQGEAFGASPSGNYATGNILISSGVYHGFLWSADAPTVYFPNTLIPGWWINPVMVLDDGTVFGFINPSSVPPSNRVAFVREIDGTMKTFQEYALERGLADANQWTFYSVNSATPDGTKFVGAGVNPQGQEVTFLIDFDVEKPLISIDPMEMNESLAAGQTSVKPLTIENPGTADLAYQAYLLPSLGKDSKPFIQVPEGPTPEKGNLDLISIKSDNETSPETKDARDVFVLNYDGPNANAVGVNAGGEFYVAARFPASMVNFLDGSAITSVDVYVGNLPIRSSLKIWGAGTTTTPGTLLLTKSFTPIASSWNTVTLTSPLSLTGEDIWVGFSFENDPLVYPAGIDGQTTNLEGNWISDDAIVWEHISDYGIIGNWNIRASVLIPEVGWLSIDPNAGIIEPDNSEIIQVGFDASGLESGIYNANILVKNNVDTEPMIFIPVTLEVANCQQYAFTTGWNSISSYFVPATPAVEILFAPITENLTIMRNLTQVYWPSEELNTIGDFDNMSGYALKVTDNVAFEICGDNLAPNQIELGAGWAYLPVLSSCEVNTMDLFGAYLNDIVIVSDLIGTQVFWPAMGVYSLDKLTPGKAYKIKTLNGFTLTFPACETKSTAVAGKQVNSISTPWGNLSMSPSTQVVSFIPTSLDIFTEGDVIGAFGDNNFVYGFMEINGNSHNQVMTLFGNDPTAMSQNGFTEGQVVNYRLYRSSTGETFDLVVEYDTNLDNASGNYFSNTFAAIVKASMLETGTGNLSSDAFQIYPNPAKDVVNFSFTGSNFESITVIVYDAKGRMVAKQVFSGQTTMNTSNLEAGIYIVNIKTDSFTQNRKLVIK